MEVVALREEALGDRVIQAVAGGSHTLAVTRSGSVIAFGSNIKVLASLLCRPAPFDAAQMQSPSPTCAPR
jgi:alpha-tubulin suppressor-like RCC1 family protein